MDSEIADVAPQARNTVEMHLQYDAHQVKAGETLTKSQAASTPRVTLNNTTAGKSYTLMMVDPDAPSPENPVMAQWLHWLVVNIPGGGDVSKGDILMEYNGPTPPLGIHRYIALLYEQAAGTPMAVQRVAARKNFNAAHWASSHNLDGPVAALYYKTAAGSV